MNAPSSAGNADRFSAELLEVYEDTEKSAALDGWLAEHRPDLRPGPRPTVAAPAPL
jgi:hypothetical protein